MALPRVARLRPAGADEWSVALRPQAHNPFLEALQEEEEEEEQELYVEVLVLELVKGPGGYGMDITDSGHVVGNSPGGVAEEAGTFAPGPTRMRWLANAPLPAR